MSSIKVGRIVRQRRALGIGILVLMGKTLGHFDAVVDYGVRRCVGPNGRTQRVPGKVAPFRR